MEGAGHGSVHFQSEIDSLSHRLIFLKDTLSSLTKNAEARNKSGLKCKQELEKAEKILEKVKQVNIPPTTGLGIN